MSTITGHLRTFFPRSIHPSYWMVIGLLLALFGQALTRDPQLLHFPKAITTLSASWNNTFYLSLNNPANIMVGLFLIMLALLIYSRLYLPLSPAKNVEEPLTSESPRLPLTNFWPWIMVNLGVYTLVMIQIARHQYSTLLLWLWLISILVFTIIFWRNEQRCKANFNVSITYLDAAWMLILFAFAISAGSYLLNDLPAGFIADEGPFWKMARGIALAENNPPFFDVGVFTFPIASSILQGWIMKWAGVNFWGWRFASLLPAALTVIPLYLLVLELFDRRMAIAANVMMIVNPYFLAFARLGYNNSQSLFPVTLCIYFLILGIRKNNRFYLWLAGVTAGLGFYTYFSAWLGFVVIVLVSLSLFSQRTWRASLISLAIVASGTLAVVLPRVLYGLSGESAISLHYKIWETGPISTFYGRFVFGDERMLHTNIFTMDEVEVFYDLPLYGILLARGVVRSAAVLFDPIGYKDHQVFFGLAGSGSSLFFILGLGVTIANIRRLQHLIPATWFLAGFFFLGVLAAIPPRPTHMVAIIPVLALISAVGLVSFLDGIFKTDMSQYNKAHLTKNIVLIAVLVIVSIFQLLQFFFLIPYSYAPPDQADYISWLGRQIPAPANLFLVDHYSTTRNPRDESLLKLTRHQVVSLTRAGLDADPAQLKTWKNFAAYISLQNDKDYAEGLAAQIPGSRVLAAYSTGRRLRGYVVTDLQINPSMNISLSHGMKDLWDSPSRFVLLICGAGIIAFLWKAKNQTSNTMSKTS